MQSLRCIHKVEECQRVLQIDNNKLTEEMKQARFYSLEGLQPQGKFLKRHGSSIFSSLCSSCTNPQTGDMDEIWPLEQKMVPSKISIKRIIKSGLGAGFVKKGGRNYSHEYRKSDISWVQGECFSKTSHDLGEESFSEHQLQGSVRIPSKIFFTYNKKPGVINNAITNCQTVNFIPNNDAYNHQKIKEGRSAKIEKRRAATRKIEKDVGGVVELSGRLQHIQQQQNQQNVKQELKLVSGRSKLAGTGENEVNASHFSFGHHQKSYFMNKLKGEGTVQQRGTETIKQLRQSIFQLSSQNNEKLSNQSKPIKQIKQNDFIQFNRGTFSKEGIFNHMRKAETLNQDFMISDSEQSVVIDNCQSYIERLQLIRLQTQPQSFSNPDI